MATKIVVAFDAYGTLLSTESVAKKLAEHFGDEKAQVLAQSWRKYQLEYTWRLNSMGEDRARPKAKHPPSHGIKLTTNYRAIQRLLLRNPTSPQKLPC